jgi:hypothetical protein
MENQGRRKVRSISEVETEMASLLVPELRDHLQINSDVYNFVGQVLEAAPDARLRDVTQARKVITCLLVRIANDLRCIGVSSVHGYAEQACTLAASLFEAAFTVLAIGENESLAQEWIDHRDPSVPFRSIRNLTLMAMQNIGIPEPERQAKRWYVNYSQLFLAKHMNPLFQATRGVRVGENQVLIVTGPDSSDESVRLAWFALEHSAGLALTAAGFFGQKNAGQSNQRELAARSRELQEVVGKLREAAAAREGWDENPFPNDWIFDEKEEQRPKTELIELAVKSAVRKLQAKDGFLIRNDVNERSITHWLAFYLQREFPGWHVDCEYNRNHEDPKTLCLPRRNDLSSDDTHARTVFPDIIVHRRDKDDNLLVVEVKKSTNPDLQSEEFDKRKLKAFKKELGYRFAAFIYLATAREAEPYRIEWIDWPTE